MIIPTILVKKREELMLRRNELKPLFKLAHLDIMDEKFVPNKTLPLDNIKRSKLKYEVHLMVKDNLTHIKKSLKLHPTAIIFHLETCRDEKEVEAIINFLKKRKIKPVIGINPKTRAAKLKPYIKKVDRILIMTVNPGFSGQKLLTSTLNKIKEIKKMNRKITIEVDGGINEKTIQKAAKAGAKLFAVGSFLTGEDLKKKKLELQRLIR